MDGILQARGRPAAVETAQGDLRKLLNLELEVVRLQQSLSLASLEFESRSAHSQRLSRRIRDAEQRAEAAEERAAAAGAQWQQLEARCAQLVQTTVSLQNRLTEALARAHAAEAANAELRATASSLARHGSEWRQCLDKMSEENDRLRRSVVSAASNAAPPPAQGLPAPPGGASHSQAAAAASRSTSASLEYHRMPPEGSSCPLQEVDANLALAPQRQHAKHVPRLHIEAMHQRQRAAEEQEQQQQKQYLGGRNDSRHRYWEADAATELRRPATSRAPQLSARAGGPPSARLPVTARLPARPRAASAAASGPATDRYHSTGAHHRRRQAQGPPTLGQDARFLEVHQAYLAVVSGGRDAASRWASQAFGSGPTVETSPRKVEPQVQGLLELFEELGLHVPLRRTGPCTYVLGSARLGVRLVCGKLVGRAGGGAVDFFSWLGRQPVQPVDGEDLG